MTSVSVDRLNKGRNDVVGESGRSVAERLNGVVSRKPEEGASSYSRIGKHVSKELT